jgi:quercetin dioxygenase-like cupin family protein
MAKNDLPDRGEGFRNPQQIGKMVDYAEGSVVSRTLVKNQAGTITLFSFATGQALSEHSAPYDAFVEILDGEAELTIGGERVSAKTGDFVIMPANIPHAVFAPGPFKMLLVMIRG